MKRFRWDANFLYWGITAFCVIVCSITFFLILSQWKSVYETAGVVLGVFAPIIYGLIFAYLLGKVMSFFEDKLFFPLLGRVSPNIKKPERTARILSVSLTMVLIVLIVSSALTLIVPQIYNSLQALVFSMDSYFNTVVGWLTKALEDNSMLEDAAINLAGTLIERITTWIQTTLLSQADKILSNLVGGVFGVIKTIAHIAVGFVISIYVMYHKERFSAQTKKVLYGIFKTKTANSLISGAVFLDKTCGSFITSKLIDSAIVGAICYVVMIVLRMPYSMLISVIVGVTNIIPFFGPFIGGIPSIILILLINPGKGLVFAIFIVILQQIDGNILYPKIQGNSIGISGFWIICSLLVFGGLFGFWGMLLGVPAFAVIYAACKTAANARLVKRGMPSDTAEFMKIRIFDAETNEPVYKDASKIRGEKNEDDGEKP